ncbi:MAG TPA: phosphatidylinositol-specific phospholipase C/glycerophosphodiester phosphodiesterase family protein [Polymorphobacter sp.]|nr:phosphatidylinositol-specific phospholipase C/glycerophosphodiester phosphodiesterase family protein [Polymorphobacter sp.]
MELIAHRRNTVAELLATPRHHGIEMDVRSWGERLVIHHDAFIEGEDFEAWLGHYAHGTLILNVKEEGLEARLLALMAAHGIERFFFLDQSFPFLIRTARSGERRCAVRVSEFESIDTALTLAGQIDWVWVDCFTRFPLTRSDAARLTGAGFKLCLVSPELQGRDAETGIAALRAEVAGFDIAAVCTKRPDLWA